MEEALIKRVLPHSIEAEQAVIGAMLMDKEAILTSSEIISGEDFYQSAYGILFETIVELFNEGKPVDLITLQNRLREKDVPAEVSSLEFARDLLSAVQTSANVKYYAEIVSEKAMLRRLIKLNEEIANICYLGKEPLEAVLETTEKKVFEACEDAMQELSNILRIVINDMQGTDVFITADHGFLYTYSPLTEGDKLGKDAISGKVYEIGRRYSLTEPSAAAEYLVPVQLDGEIVGTPVKGYTPFDSTRIRISGGGENYVHGGISLQEIVVPVISFKNLRSTSKKYVEVSNAELKLLSESRKVSNLLFSLDFYQRQPVGEKIQPCTYYIYMTDDEGVVISDRQTVIADRTSTNASERVFRVRLNLKAGAYDKNKIYRLVIANDTDVPEEAEFHIDIAFADDFGFDL